MKFVLENCKTISVIPFVLISVAVLEIFSFIYISEREQSRIEDIAKYDLTEYHKQDDKLDHKKRIFKKVIVCTVYLAFFLMLILYAIKGLNH